MVDERNALLLFRAKEDQHTTEASKWRMAQGAGRRAQSAGYRAQGAG